LFEVHVALLRELYLRLCEAPLSDEFLARQTQDLHEHHGDVDALLARTARLRTWAFVANRAGWVRHAEHWRERLTVLEDALSDSLHSGLVSSFVERRSRARPSSKHTRPLPGTEEPDRDFDPHHPFAGLQRLRARAHAPVPEPEAPSSWEELVDAPHERFELSESGVIRAGALELARLSRGASLTQPQIRLQELADVPAGVRSQLQRRLLAFARDVSGRLLASLEPLRRADRAPLRAIAYQLEQGLGSAAREALSATLGALSPEDRALLNGTAVEPGRLAVYLPELLTPAALSLRLTLVRAFEPDTKLPPVGRATFDPQHLSAFTWLALGYVVLGRRAFRLDLAERVAALFANGAPEQEALACLSLSKKDWPAVSSTFKGALTEK
jgi:ATP-dependent RNA helicase SUPV3L1/SUV3